ncbi:MAG: outer membrane beta-barrel protein [Saprospiraceae bacterium]
MINLKKISFFLLFFVHMFISQAQTSIELIQINNARLRAYTDSLQYFSSQFTSHKIDELNYQISVNRISSEISVISGSNYELTYALVDSVYYANYKNEVPNPETTPIDPPMTEEPVAIEPMDTSFVPTKRKKTVVGEAMKLAFPNPDKRTNINFSFGIGFTGLTQNIKEYNYPNIKPFENFYFQNIQISWRTRIGKLKSPFAIRYGIGLDYVSLNQTSNLKLLSKINGVPIFQDAIALGINNLDEVKIRLKYLKIPLGLYYSFNKKTALHVGGYYNRLIRQRVEQEYKDLNDDDYNTSSEKDFGLNKNEFGLEYSFRYKYYVLFFEHSLNSILNEKAPKDLNYMKFGLGFRI